MAYRKGPGEPKEREAFMEANADLLARCCDVPSKERKMHMRNLVVRARAHFGYSMKTIAYDIVRPVLKAYGRYLAERSIKTQNTRSERVQEEATGSTYHPASNTAIEAHGPPH